MIKRRTKSSGGGWLDVAIAASESSPLEREIGESAGGAADRDDVLGETFLNGENDYPAEKTAHPLEQEAPPGCWIECGKVPGRKFRQAYWRSNSPIFPSARGRGLVCRRYIGKEGSPDHMRAIEAYRKRKAAERKRRENNCS